MRQRSEGSWELRVFIGADPLTGKPRYRTKTIRGGKRRAQDELAAMVSEGREAGPSATVTIRETFERWFEHARPGFSPSTAATTRVILDSHLLPYVGNIRLAKLTAAKIDALYSVLAEQGGRDGKPLSPATIQRAHNVLHRAMEQAVRWEWLPVNPAGKASPPRRGSNGIRPPTPEELHRLFAQAQRTNPALGVYVVLAAATGARRGELIALRWSDVDFDEGALEISRGVVVGLDGLVEKDTKTHATRRISLDARTVSMLQEFLQSARSRARECGVEVASDGFVFSMSPEATESWRPNYVTLAFARAARRADVPRVRLHDLRHFVASQLLASGVDVRTVAGRLGHRNPNVTLNVYAHFLPPADRKAADVLGRLLDGAGDGQTPPTLHASTPNQPARLGREDQRGPE